MAVKIEMDMPESCWLCRLSFNVETIERTIMCPLFGDVSGYVHFRNIECPLKECK